MNKLPVTQISQAQLRMLDCLPILIEGLKQLPGGKVILSEWDAARDKVVHSSESEPKVIITKEMVEKAAFAIERFNNPQWTDEQFDIWWNKDHYFVTQINSWVGFTGTKKEKVIAEARAALTAIFSNTKVSRVPDKPAIVVESNECPECYDTGYSSGYRINGSCHTCNYYDVEDER